MSHDPNRGQSDASMKDAPKSHDDDIERLRRELGNLGYSANGAQLRGLWDKGFRKLGDAIDELDRQQKSQQSQSAPRPKRPPAGLQVKVPRHPAGLTPIRSPDHGRPSGQQQAPFRDNDQKEQAPVTQPNVRGSRKKKKKSRQDRNVDASQLKRGNCMRYIKKKKILAETLYGCVRKGTDRVTKETIVIKESRKDLVKKGISTKGVKVREDIRKEIQIHGFLSNPRGHQVDIDPCPYLVRNIDVCQDPNYIYQILEVCPTDLFDHVVKLHEDCMGSPQWRAASGNRDEERRLFRTTVEVHVRRLYRQVIEGVKFMHKLCVCHLDLSLENVLVGMDGCSRICDFGLAAYCGAKIHEDPAKRFEIKGCFGKRGYMAPEMMSKQRCDGRKADMWSCAVIMFCMLLNSPPYDVPNITDFKFRLLWEGNIADYLRRCGRAHLFSDEAVQVMEALFRPENGPRARMLPRELLQLDFFRTNNNTANNDSRATHWTYRGDRMDRPDV